jgi:hypothetical protein
LIPLLIGPPCLWAYTNSTHKSNKYTHFYT